MFWELIVPKILEIADSVGCKYVYLFAADNSQTPISYTEQMPWEEDYYESNSDVCEKVVVRKLVEYYMNELKFTNVTQYKILKPHYGKPSIMSTRYQNTQHFCWV